VRIVGPYAPEYRNSFLDGSVSIGDSVYFFITPVTETMSDGTPHTAYIGVLEHFKKK